MLKLLLGKDWISNSNALMNMLSEDVAAERGNRILIVPESISHNAERRLCQSCGDTASRFAEVLSFTRLVGRVQDATRCGAAACMDAGGRVVAMAAAAVQMHSRLKAYAAVETKPEFLISLVDALDEFKRCCIRPEDLQIASRSVEGSLAQKLEELSLLFEAYDAICSQGKRDPSDQLTWVLEQLEDSSFAQEHVFYFDGFTDFTGQQMAVVRHLIEMSPQVTVCLNCDELSSADPAFDKASDTAAQLLVAAKDAGVVCDIVNVPVQAGWKEAVCKSLFCGKILQNAAVAEHLHICQFTSVSDECDYAADQIAELVRKGCRYRDIRVVCTDLDAYRSPLNLSLIRRNIPVYMSGTEGVLDMPVINTVLTALDAACGGFEQQTVIRYLRSALSPVDLETCDQLENYAIIWSISGSRWNKPWVNHPDGLDGIMDETANERLAALNSARERAIAPLECLACAFSNATALKDLISGLYAFLEEIDLASRLERLAEMETGAQAQVLSQLWEILLTALEQLYDVLGHLVWSGDVFVRLLRLLLSQYDVGTIPPVLDAVTVGSVAASRYHSEKYLFVLGAQEGALPRYGTGSGVFSDQERTVLRKMGVPLTSGSLDSLQSEFADIYNVFSGAQEAVWLSCPSAQTSFVYRRLSDLVGFDAHPEMSPSFINVSDAAALLARYKCREEAEKLGIQNQHDHFLRCAEHTLGKVSEKGISDLYGKKLNLSASQVDKLADCRLAYFLKYGLRAKERKEATVDPAEFGTYVHAVLEQTAREIKDLGGFHCVDLEKALDIANKYSEDYARERFSQLDSKRIAYLFNRNASELKAIVTELWEELQVSEFEPVSFELSFGDGADMPAICLPDGKIPAQLRGFVDRVDKWENEGNSYFRVVDYKTGRKDFDYCDVFNGLGLQMLLYLFALEDNGSAVLGENPVPAGVQYFPARVPLVSADSLLTEGEAQQARQKLWKRKGLVLNEQAVLHAMETTGEPVRTGYTQKKDGSISGDIADRKQLQLLRAYIFMLLRKMVDEVASGCVEANPYTRGSSHNACAFCPYGAVCHPAQVDGRRDYRAMTAEFFWEQIGKEMGSHG